MNSDRKPAAIFSQTRPYEPMAGTRMNIAYATMVAAPATPSAIWVGDRSSTAAYFDARGRRWLRAGPVEGTLLRPSSLAALAAGAGTTSPSPPARSAVLASGR